MALSVPASCDASCGLPALLLTCGFYSLRVAAVRVLNATAVEAVGWIVGVSDGIVVAERVVGLTGMDSLRGGVGRGQGEQRQGEKAQHGLSVARLAGVDKQGARG